MRQNQISKYSIALAFLIALCCSLFTFYFSNTPKLEGSLGICLPSLNLWQVEPLISWILNISVISGIAVALIFYNRFFNIVKDTSLLFPGFFLITACSNPWLLYRLNSSTLMAAVNLGCIWFLSKTYKKDNSTQEYFAIATLLSLASMLQYAALLMIPAYIVGGIICKSLKFKESIAFILGLAAPYWVGVGLGLISPFNFSIPTFTNLFADYASDTDIFLILVNIGITIILALLMAMNVGVKQFAGNSRRRALTNVFNVVGLFSAIYIVINANNIMAYESTVYMTFALLLTNIFSLYRIRRPWILWGAATLLYMAFFLSTALTGINQ